MSAEKSTRAAVPAPPRKSFLPEVTAPVEAADNMKGERLAAMTFNMPKDWHTRFKMTAASRDLSMKELLIESFEAWERQDAERHRRK